MQGIPSSDPSMVTRICEPIKFQAQHNHESGYIFVTYQSFLFKKQLKNNSAKYFLANIKN